MINHRTKIDTAFEIACDYMFGSNWRERTAWCFQCESHVPMISSLTAATFDQTTVLEIFRRAEAGELHYEVTVHGTLLICLGSLLKTDQISIREKTVF